jgi:hypothetical protein
MIGSTYNDVKDSLEKCTTLEQVTIDEKGAYFTNIRFPHPIHK